MSQSEKKNRIIFIDLLRAFAVLMMVQGHTVDVLLSNDHRTFDSPFFAVWHFMRGMTAPVFLFTAGTVFTYLFRLVKEPFSNNPRVIKGIKRFFLLLFLGYMLRYPTPSIIMLGNISERQWRIFYAVDILHLIAFGILFIIICMYIAEKLKLGDYMVFGTAAVLFFGLHSFFQNINWIEILPLPLAGYMYRGTGSNFPLFPWVGYVLAGGILGSLLARKPEIFRTFKFSRNLGLIGISLILISFTADYFETQLYGRSYFWTVSPNLIILRIGIVLLLNSIVSAVSLRVESIPRIIILIGRNTLIIYIVHLLILYGSAWNPGVIKIFEKSFGVWNTIGSALLMLFLMTTMVFMISKFRIKNKQLVT
jgi:uncharacterized membrane protein